MLSICLVAFRNSSLWFYDRDFL